MLIKLVLDSTAGRLVMALAATTIRGRSAASGRRTATAVARRPVGSIEHGTGADLRPFPPWRQGGITADTAIRLGKATGTSAEMWLGLQAAHDLEAARRPPRAGRQRCRADRRLNLVRRLSTAAGFASAAVAGTKKADRPRLRAALD